MRFVSILVSGLLFSAVPGSGTSQSVAFAQAPLPVPPAAGRGTVQVPPRDGAAPKVGTGIIRGRVVNADNGQPLRRAQVRLSSPDLREPRTAGTDEQGRFEFQTLPASRYTLSASKSGFLMLSYGQRRPFEAPRPIELADAQVIEKVDFSLPRGSVLVVRMTDEFGEPMSQVNVQAQQSRFVASSGKRELVAVGGNDPFSGTNDLGEIRLYGLPPGEYYLNASSRNAMTLGIGDTTLTYAPTFYPGTTSVSEAQRVTLGIGQELAVSFPLMATRAARVSGVVRAADGSVPVRPSVSLTQRVGEGGITSRGMPVQPDGSFTLPNVMPGDYTLDARTQFDSDQPVEGASLPIRIDGADVTNLVITMNRGATFRGQILFDVGQPPRDLRPSTMSVTTQPTGGPPFGMLSPRQKTNEDWTFEVSGVIGSRLVRINTGPMSGWYLKSVIRDGRDITDAPIDFDVQSDVKDVQIVLTQKRSEVNGSVVDSKKAPATDYVTLIFPEDREQWTSWTRFIASGRPDQQGRFKISGLPPGRYLAAAVDYLETGRERDPEMLDRLKEGASKFTLGEGETTTLALTLQTTP